MSSINFIDSHCHLHDAEFFDRPSAEELINNAKSNQVSQIICIGTDHQDSLQAAEFATSHQDIFWTYGFHPSATDSISNDSELKALMLDIDKIEPLLKASMLDKGNAHSSLITSMLDNENINSFSTTSMLDSESKPNFEAPVAIGEIGLDYHYPTTNKAAQFPLLERQLQLALDLGLPVSFHIRDAFADFWGIIANFPKIRGVIHSFSDDQANLKKCLNRDFYIGVNGIATFAKIPLPPLERTLLETDAPFLAPAPVRGRSNQPAYIPHIADFLAKHHSCTTSEVAEITTKNTRTLFGL